MNKRIPELVHCLLETEQNVPKPKGMAWLANDFLICLSQLYKLFYINNYCR